MSLPYSDPSNPALPSPLFSDVSAARGDHLRGNNAAIWGNFAVLEDNGLTLTSTPNAITATGLQQKYICNSASAMINNLPAASGSGNKVIFSNKNTGEVALTPHGTDTINGVNAAWYIYQYEGVELIDAASGAWLIVNKFSMQGSAKAWITARRYRVGEIVLSGNFLYACLVAHTAGTFATDLASGYWSISAMSTIQQHGFLPKSQCAIAGAVDSNGQANFLSASTDGVALSATTTNILIAYANGQDEYGQKNYIEKISADVAKASTWGTLPAGTSYLYKELDITDPLNPVATYGSSLEQPDYVTADNQSNYSILHFEDASVILDDYGHTWTKGAGVSRSNTQAKIGTYSALFDGGSAGHITSDFYFNANKTVFTLECWFYSTSINTTQIIFDSAVTSTRSLLVRLVSSKFNVTLGSTDAATDIINNITGNTTLSSNTWYHVALVFDGTTYKLYLDGTAESNVTTTSSLQILPTLLRIGLDYNNSQGFVGYIDEFRYTPSVKYTGNFTAPTVAFTKDASIYNITLRKFPYIATNRIRCYLGEAVSNGSTVSSVITYALNGEYRKLYLYTTNIAESFSHNIGTVKVDDNIRLCNVITDKGWTPGQYVSATLTGDAAIGVPLRFLPTSRNTSLKPLTYGGMNVLITSNGTYDHPTINYWMFDIYIKRSF
jgi:hypothetical protein